MWSLQCWKSATSIVWWELDWLNYPNWTCRTYAHISYWQSELLTSCHHRYSINKTMTELQLIKSFRENIKSNLIVVGIGGNGKRMVLTVWRSKYRFHTLTTWTLCYPWPVLNLIMLHNSSWTFRSPLFAALIDSDFNRSLKSERWLPSENKAIFFRVR